MAVEKQTTETVQTFRDGLLSQTYREDVPLWHNRLPRMWRELASFPTLGDIAEIHRGVEYKIQLPDGQEKQVYYDGWVQGLRSVTSDLEPYIVRPSLYIHLDPQLMWHEEYLLPWEKPKVIVNGAVISQNPWRIIGALDEQGLVCTQNLLGIWPTGVVPIEVIAALLNGPVANAFLNVNGSSRYNHIPMLQRIPVPRLDSWEIHEITSLVRSYMATRERWQSQPEDAKRPKVTGEGIVGRIEEEILGYYHLSMKAERELLACFEGYTRPGPIPLTHVEPSPQNRLYPSLVRVEDIRGEGDEKIVDVEIFACEYDQIFHLPIALFPQELRKKISQDVYLWAGINIEAREAKDIVFENIRLAPEPRQEFRDRFARFA